MLIKGLVDEDFVNFKVPSMYIATATCSFKCDKEYGSPICQNSELAKQPTIDIPVKKIIDRYLSNPITHAIVLGGLEPFDQFNDVVEIIRNLRLVRHHITRPGEYEYRNHPKSMDAIIVYTGYTKDELDEIYNEWTIFHDRENLAPTNITDLFENFKNIIIKFGRYIPNQQPHYDPVLGVYLASDNQYAERIS